jgi:hypothetical protein
MRARFAVAALTLALALGTAACGPAATAGPPPAAPDGTAAATGGRAFDSTHVNDIQKGTHDKAQIQAWFGQPFKVMAPLPRNPAGCVERWLFVQTDVTAVGATVTSYQSKTLVVDLDAAGKVCDHAFIAR